MATQIEANGEGGGLFVDGFLAPKTMSYPNGCIDNTHVDGSTDGFVDADSLVHRLELTYAQEAGTDVATATQILHIVFGDTATLSDITLYIDTAPTGGNKQYTVDLEYSAAGGTAWASILQEEVTVSSSNSDGQAVTPILADTDFVDGDQFRVVITASGSTGSQGQGFCLHVFCDEEPQT